MSIVKKIINSIDIFKRCKRYRLKSVWQCPEFLFLFFGVLIILIIIITNILASSYTGPELAALSTLLITAPLLIIAYSITKSFEYLALTSEMKSEFIAIMSHQLRSPLVSIKWQIEGYLIKDPPAETKLVIDSIQKENERMLATINKFLELKRIEEGDFFLNKKNFSLLELIKEIAEVKNKKIKIVVKYESPSYDILADRDKIKFVLENIIDNALNYGFDKNQVEILMEKINGDIKISISDKGPGISSDSVKYIFQKFARPEESLKYKVPGLGIGLYLSKNIIEKHQGKIGFQTQKGMGSTFWFTLPVKNK